ncbi:MAG: hypothetical protein WDN69_10425 [Aliidongia sp.]
MHGGQAKIRAERRQLLRDAKAPGPPSHLIEGETVGKKQQQQFAAGFRRLPVRRDIGKPEADQVEHDHAGDDQPSAAVIEGQAATDWNVTCRGVCHERLLIRLSWRAEPAPSAEGSPADRRDIRASTPQCLEFYEASRHF